MTNNEAKLVVVLRCAFFIEDDQLSKMARMLWGEKRVRELVGMQQHQEAGEDLIMAAEETLKLQHGELEKLTLEECKCRDCGHTEYYLTSMLDVGKACAACKHKNSVFLPTVEDIFLTEFTHEDRKED